MTDFHIGQRVSADDDDSDRGTVVGFDCDGRCLLVKMDSGADAHGTLEVWVAL